MRSRNRLVRSTSVPTAVRPAFAQDDVALPVARNGTIVCFGGPLGDHDHPRQAPALLRPALGTAGGASGTQTAAVFADGVVATAILDRLLHHATVVNIRGQSYRMRAHVPSPREGAAMLG